MSRRIVHVVTCDLAHEVPYAVIAAETAQLSLNGRSVTVDLCADHAEELFGEFEPFLAAGRPARRRRGRSPE